MGMKSLRLQMMPWCFHMMGAAGDDEMEPSAAKNNESGGKRGLSIRLIRWDGKVEVYERAVKVSEITKEFPKYLVCHSESFCIGQKVPALSDKDQLQMGQSYFVLPSHFFQSVLSFVSIATSFSKNNMCGGGKAAMQPMLNIFDVCRSPTGSLQIRVSDDFIQKLVDGEREDEDEGEARSRLCTSVALEKEYRQLVRLRSLQWKPKLDCITETSEKPPAPRFGFAGKIKEKRMAKKKKMMITAGVSAKHHRYVIR